MRFLTKEWWIKGSVSFEDEYLRETEAAAEKDEEFFAWAYNEAYEKHKKSVGRLIEIRDGEFAQYLFESRYQEKIKNSPDAYYLKWLVVANHLLYAMSSTSEQKENYWKECIHYYQILDDEEKLDEEWIPFLLEYLHIELDRYILYLLSQDSLIF